VENQKQVVHRVEIDAGHTVNLMKTNLLYDSRLELPLINWLEKHGDVATAMVHIRELSARLTNQVIEGSIADGAHIIGPVHIGDGSSVAPTAVLVGPAIIGADTEVAPHAMICKNSFIGSKCVIGHGAYIENSIILNEVIVHPGAYIRNSIIGVGCVIAPKVVVGGPVSKDESLPSSVGIKADTFLVSA